MNVEEESGNVKLQSSYLDHLPALFRRELTVDVERKRVRVADEQVSLLDHEFNLLAFLHQNAGRTCTLEEIISNVELPLEAEESPAEEAVHQTIQHIRQLVEHDPSMPHFIKSVDSVGYRFDTDEFLGRFLLIFEGILKPIENMVDNLAHYLDPLTTPKALLPWLASWVAFALDPKWPEHKRRELVKRAAELYRWRGTKRGLAEYLRIYAGVDPEITEHTPGMRLESCTKLGINARLGSSGGGYHFTVTLETDKGSDISESKVRSIIDAQKPAHTVYTLRLVKNDKSKNGG